VAEAASGAQGRNENPVGPILSLRQATGLTWSRRAPLLVYGFLTTALVAVVLAPLGAWLVLAALRITVGDAVVNFDLASFAASLPALAIGLLWAVSTAALTLIGFGGPVLILSEGLAGRTPSLRAVTGRVARSLPRAAAQGAIRLTLLVFLAMPLVGLAVSLVSAVALAPLGGIEIESILPDNFIDTSVVITAVLVLGGVCFLLAVRWSFCLQYFLVERRPLGASMKESAGLACGNFAVLSRTYLLGGIVHAGVVAFAALLLGGLHWLVLRGLGLHEALGVDLTLALLLVLDTVLLTAVVTLTTANGLSLVTVAWTRLLAAEGSAAEGAAPLTEAGAPRKKNAAGILGLVLVALAVGTALTLPGIAEERTALTRTIAVTAHRGNSSVAPDNTLAAIRASITARADYAEIDIQEAQDGTLVVIHDTNLKKIAGLDRNLFDMTWEELKTVNVGSHFDPKFASETIPTLEQAILAAGKDLKLNIELKVHGHERKLAESAVAVIGELGFGKRCVITSLDAAVLAQVRRLDPELPLGIILTAFVGDVHGMDVDFYSVNALLASNAFIRGAHARGRDVHVWTLNEPDKIRRMLNRFPDNIISDYPERVRTILEARTPEDVAAAAVRRLFGK